MRAVGYSLAQVAKSHNAFSMATILKDGVEQFGKYALLGGEVQVNAGVPVRRYTNGLTFVGYRPELDPFRCEVKLYRSVNTEYVPLGVFRMEDPEFSHGRDGKQTTVSCFDRAYWISTLRLPAPYSIVAGTPIHEAIQGLISSRAAGLTYSFATTTDTMPATTFEEESDPWEKAQEMAKAAGMELFFDTNGVCVLRPVATLSAGNVVAAFGTTARILDLKRKTTTRNTYSHVIVTGENTTNPFPVRAEVFDDDPTSDTYYLGKFGDRTTWLRSQFIRTTDQALNAGRALLSTKRGRVEVITIDTIPNPAFDAGDVVSILDTEVGVNAIHMLDTMKVPLIASARMTATTRSQRAA